MIRTISFITLTLPLAVACASPAFADAELRQSGDRSQLAFEQPVGGTAEIVVIGDDSRTSVKQLGRGRDLEVTAIGDGQDNRIIAGGCTSWRGYEPVLIAGHHAKALVFVRCDIR